MNECIPLAVFLYLEFFLRDPLRQDTYKERMNPFKNCKPYTRFRITNTGLWYHEPALWTPHFVRDPKDMYTW